MKIYRKCLAIVLITIFVGASFGASDESLSCDAYGPYEGNIMDDIEFDGTATDGTPPYEYLWDYGDGNTSTGDPHPTHNYANAGNYTVILTVTDSEDDTASDTTWAYINAPPNKPSIEGPNSGKSGTKYEFDFCTTDPDGDDVFYCIDWGDGSGEICIGPFPSETCVTEEHTWSSDGTYNIKAKASDIYDAESDYTIKSIKMPKNKAIQMSPFLNFLENHHNLFQFLQRMFQRLGLQ